MCLARNGSPGISTVVAKSPGRALMCLAAIATAIVLWERLQPRSAAGLKALLHGRARPMWEWLQPRSEYGRGSGFSREPIACYSDRDSDTIAGAFSRRPNLARSLGGSEMAIRSSLAFN